MTTETSTSADPRDPPFAFGLAMLICGAAALVLAYPALGGGFLVNPHSDQYIAGFAFRDFAAQALRTSGEFPLWNPYLSGGLPYVAAMHGDIFYPTFLLRIVMPTDIAMTWGMIVHFWLAGVFAYALFRAHGIGFHAALIGGVAYMMSGMVAGLVSPGHDGKLFITALFPLTLLVLRHGVRHGRLWAWGALAIVVGLGVLTPHPQLLQYLLLAAGVYALFLAFFEGGEGAPTPRQGAVRLGVALAAVAAGFAIGAVQILPLREYTAWSPRSGGHDWATATSYSMPPEEIINTVLPQFSGILDNYWGRNGIHYHSEYLGFPVLFLAAAAFGVSRGRRWVWFWLGLTVVSLLWAFGGFTPFFQIPWHLVPGTKYFRAPSTIMFLSAFGVAAMAAMGAQRILRGEVSGRYLAISGGVLGVVAALGITSVLSNMFSNLVPEYVGFFERFEANKSNVMLGAWRMLAFGGIALAIIAAIRRQVLAPTVGAAALLLVVVADLWSVERHYWLFSPRASELYASDEAIERIRSDSVPGRVLAVPVGDGMMPGDVYFRGGGFMAHGVRTVTGYHGNAIKRWEEIAPQTQPETVIRRALESPPFTQMVNLRWLYTDTGELGPEFERVVGPVKNSVGSTVWLYKWPAENPPAWVVPAMMKVPDASAGAYVIQPDFPVRSVALLSEQSALEGEQLTVAPQPLELSARVTHYAAGEIDVELSDPAPARSALVVSENFYPGWTATVDGRPATAERVNYTLIGVPLEAGARHVELRFTNPPYETGAKLTLAVLVLSVIATAGGAIVDRRRVSV